MPRWDPERRCCIVTCPDMTVDDRGGIRFEIDAEGIARHHRGRSYSVLAWSSVEDVWIVRHAVHDGDAPVFVVLVHRQGVVRLPLADAPVGLPERLRVLPGFQASVMDEALAATRPGAWLCRQVP